MQSSYGVKVFLVSNRNDGSIKVKYYEGLNFNNAHEYDATEVFNNTEELYNFITTYQMSGNDRAFLASFLPQEMQVRINRLNGNSMFNNDDIISDNTNWNQFQLEELAKFERDINMIDALSNGTELKNMNTSRNRAYSHAVKGSGIKL